MKKPTNPTIKVHLLPTLFILLSLLAIGVIPFAQAQRNATGAKPNARAYARPAAGTPLTQLSRARAPGQSRVPAFSGPAALAVALPAPAAPLVTLYDQLNNPGTVSTGSQDFEAANNAFDDFTADDFVVPGGQTWTISEVDAQGVYFNGSGPAASFHVFFYQDSGGLPGTQVYSAMAQSYVNTSGVFQITLAAPAVLTAGTYWVSVQARMDFTPNGQWGWTDRTVQANSPAAWQNPGGGFAVCPTWGVRQTCTMSPAGEADQMFRLIGVIGGGPSCNTYTISTSTGNAIVPGTVDTGNHTDDGTTSITLPFSVQFYGQTYAAANLSSNGNLQFVSNSNLLTNACPLPSATFNFAVMPHWDDMRTDQVGSGCTAYGGVGCGIFTSASGTAPNRIFNIEWRTVYFGANTTRANFEARLHESGGQVDFVYGEVAQGGSSATVGVQRDTGGAFSQFECNTAATLTSGLGVTFTCAGTPTPTPTPTPSPTCTPGTWVTRADYPLSVYGAGNATDGTSAYVFGGNTIGGAQHAEAYRYDPVANTWSALANMTAGADYLLHAEYGGNGKIYVMGGLTGGTLNRIYDIATNSWSSGAPVPVAVYDHGHAYANGKIYVMGGIVGGVASSAVYAYDVATNTWSAPLAPLPQAEFDMACGVINNKIYVAGGSTGSNFLTNLYIYDIGTNTWSSGASLLVGANFPAGAVVGGKLWVIGGGNPFDAPAKDAPFAPQSFNNTQIYDPGTNSWSNGPTLNTGRSFADAVTLNLTGGQAALIVGGYNSSSGTSLSSVEMNATNCGISGGCSFRVLIAYADTDGQPTQLQAEILAEPGVVACDLFDATSATPTLGQLQQYQIVVPFSNSPFFDGAALGNNLADYVDGGGIVVQYGFSHYGPGQPYGVNGRWVTGNYNPYNYSTNLEFSAFSLGTFNAGHPLMAGVTMLNSNFANIVTPAAGATEVAQNSLSESLVAFRPVSGGHTTVGVAAYVGSDAVQSGDWGRVIVNAGRWLLNCSGPTVSSAVSRLTHGGAGNFDVNLPLTGANGVECRTKGGTNDYTMVVTFGGNVTVTGSPQAQVTMGSGCVGSAGVCAGNVTVSGNVVTVPLTNITNAQNINVRINGVNNAGADAPAADINIPMGVLAGDSNANRTVNAADIAQTKARLGQAVDGTNFRSDVNANGSINAADVAIIKQNSGTSIP